MKLNNLLIVSFFVLLRWTPSRVNAQQCEVATTCVTDLTVEDCGGSSYTLEPNSHIFNCCPRCVLNVNPNPETEGCQPPSNCLADGRYAPVQCKGDNFVGRCFCSDERGNRIFGQMWRSEASDMTCACSRRRAELEASGRVDVTLHCSANGDYEPLQCDDGLCWCAKPRTGQPTVMPVPESDMVHLPCYSAAQIGEQYLRRCESVVHALAVINKEQSEHGTNFLGNSITFCDYDGSYGPYQIVNSIAYCTGRDGTILGAWQVVSSEMAGINCNCARDTIIYFPERGMDMSLTCQANGNYRPNQNTGNVYFCVDTDGYAVTDFLEAWPQDNCASFARQSTTNP